MNEPTVAPWARRPEVRIGAVVAIAIAAAFLVWLLVKHGDDSGEGAQTIVVSAITPVAATPERLRELSVEAGHPVYWLGPEKNRSYELTRTSDDRIFVRYLPQDVEVGTDAAIYPIVGTYPFPDAYAGLQDLAKKKNEVSFTAPNGGLAVYSADRPTNVYLAFPGSDSQIEVFDPSTGRARELVASGRVAPVR